MITLREVTDWKDVYENYDRKGTERNAILVGKQIGAFTESFSVPVVLSGMEYAKVIGDCIRIDDDGEPFWGIADCDNHKKFNNEFLKFKHNQMQGGYLILSGINRIEYVLSCAMFASLQVVINDISDLCKYIYGDSVKNKQED